MSTTFGRAPVGFKCDGGGTNKCEICVSLEFYSCDVTQHVYSVLQHFCNENVWPYFRGLLTVNICF